MQNISQRAEREIEKAEAATAAATPSRRASSEPPKKKRKKEPALPKGKRLRSDQAKMEMASIRSAAHIKATIELFSAQQRGGGRAPNGTVKEIVDRINTDYALTTPEMRLTAGAITKAVSVGRTGQAPELPGPKGQKHFPVLPQAVAVEIPEINSALAMRNLLCDVLLARESI